MPATVVAALDRFLLTGLFSRGELMQEVVNSLLKLFDRLGWPGIAVALSLFMYQETKSEIRVWMARHDEQIIILEQELDKCSEAIRASTHILPRQEHRGKSQ